MSVRDAIQKVREMVDERAALVAVGEALSLLENGEAQLDALLKRSDEIKRRLAEEETKFKNALAKMSGEQADAEAGHRTKMEGLKREIAEAQAKLEAVYREHAQASAKAQTDHKILLNSLSAERQKTISGLNSEIEQKAARLDSLNKEIETIRAKVFN